MSPALETRHLARRRSIAPLCPLALVLATTVVPAQDDGAHWAYAPVSRPSVPAGADHPIDAFLEARLAEAGIEPSARADAATQLRRVTFALTGLPPSHDEARAAARGEFDYGATVDALLASPEHAEHLAREWLDLARYADTKGYEADRRRPHMWRYRDWVIDAFDRDLPYDEFIVEQLAGDLLPDPTLEQRVATAFHRNTMTNDEGGTDDEEFRCEAVIDRVNTTCSVFLGTTMECARCHDHKYDPFSQREYYELFAFFDQTEDADRQDEAPRLEAPTLQQAEALAVIERERAALPTDAADARQALDERERALGIPRVLTMRELPPDRRRTTLLFVRGSFLDRGEAVAPGTPAVWPPLAEDAPRNRLGLARWIASAEHPLTARVAVNRAWARMFGTGLVARGEDWGTQGERPSHPDLLDWLASEFVARGWSHKELLRLIATSEAFRRSSATRDDLRDVDPENRLLARGPRVRLAAEEIRDAALAASGLLEQRVGGPSVMPPQPPGIWKMIYSNDAWRTSEGRDRYRRGLYTFWRRTAPYPSMVAFDAPSREACTVRRTPTNTPLQALTLLNDPAFVECAEALARDARAAEFGGFLDEVFLRCLGREPRDDERALLMAYAAGEPEDRARAAVCSVVLNLDEAITR